MGTIAEDERSGTTPYVTLLEVAAGGMGRVDVALRVEGEFRRLYAIKRLHAHLREDPEFLQMFVDEARVAGLVRHPNVVSVLDVGVDERGPFLVMDYIDGVSLSRLLSFVAASERRLPLQIALRIAIDVAKGLHAIHEARGHDGQPLHLVHRDLSPQNVLVAYAGVASITDFGIAKAVGGQSQRTSTGVLKGKVSYMSPEQLRFEDVDRRSDLFSFGVVFYEMLAGHRLYRNTRGNEGAQRILHEPPPDLGDDRPDAPASLVELLFELLAKQPDERPPTAAVVARRLDRILAEVVVREPTIELGSYVEGMTEDVREEQHAAIRAATSRLAKGSAAWTGVPAIPISVEMPLEAHNSNPPTVAGRRTITRNGAKPWRAIAVAVTAVLGVMAIAAWWIGSEEPAMSAPGPMVVAPATPSTIVASHESAPAVVAPPPVVEAQREGAPEIEAERDLEAAAPTPIRRPNLARRPRRPPGASTERSRLGDRVGWEE